MAGLGHPPLCLPPGTAQRLPDRNQKVFRRAAIYSANSSRWHKCTSGWSLKTEKIHCQWHVYIDTTHTIWHLFLTWTSLYPFALLKTPNICGNPLAFSLTFDLQYYLNCTVLRHTSALIKDKQNKVKSEYGSHIRIHTTYNSFMFTYNICKPDDKCRVNTDLQPLKSGEHKINNIEWATTPYTGINDLHALYMILCKMREWFDG